MLRLTSLASLTLISVAALGGELAAQGKGGGGTTPPPDPAIAFSDIGIKVMNADGTNVRTVLALATGDEAGGPSWSPDGQQLAFEATLSGLRGIWKVNLDGSGLQFLAPQAGNFLWTTTDWSRVPAPDGQYKIAFRSAGVGGESDVFVVNTDGSGLQNLTNSPESDQNPSWTADATGIYVGWMTPAKGVLRLRLAALSGGGVQVTEATEMLYGWFFVECSVAHDGGRILFRGGTGALFAIYSIDPSVEPWTPQLLYGNDQVKQAPSFSPNDQKLVMRRGGNNKIQGIYTANADGSGSVRIRSTGFSPAWRHN